MTLVLWGVSPIGLGHATRGVAVAQELQSRGLEVVFATGGNAVGCISSYGMKVHDFIREPVPSVRSGEMKNASFWYLQYWLGYRRSKAAMRKLIDTLEPDLVVGDEEFAGVSIALETRRRHALISDELELGFARSFIARPIERRVARWYGGLQARVSALIVPDFGNDAGNRHYVTPVVRRVTASRERVIEELSLPSGGPMVLFSMSGAGIGDSLLQNALEAFRRLRIPGAFFVIAGNWGTRLAGGGVYDVGPVRDGQNLVAAADLVISTAGKSTLDEAASAGTPIIAIPIRNHAEQQRNAGSLGYRAEDASRLGELIAEKMGHREAPRKYDGASRAAKLLAGMAD